MLHLVPQAHDGDIVDADRLVSCAVVPIVIAGRVEGLIYAVKVRLRPFTDEDEAALVSLADQAALAIQNATLLARAELSREAAVAAQRRSAFLAEAGAILAGSLDDETRLPSIAELAVRRIADWCAIDLIEEDGSVRRAALACANPARVAELEILRRLAADAGHGEVGVQHVLRFGRTQFMAEITDELLTAGARSATHLDVLRRVRPVSGIVAPLAARDAVLGAVSLYTAESGRR